MPKIVGGPIHPEVYPPEEEKTEDTNNVIDLEKRKEKLKPDFRVRISGPGIICNFIGEWTTETVEDFEAYIVPVADYMRLTGESFYFIANVEEFPIQSPEIIGRLFTRLDRGFANGIKKLFLVDRGLTRKIARAAALAVKGFNCQICSSEQEAIERLLQEIRKCESG